MDKTVKIRALTEEAKGDAGQGKRADEKGIPADDRARLSSLLEEERSKSLELLKEIVQLRESLKQEQAKSADLEAKLTRLAVVEENQLAKKNAQLEEERKSSLELMRTIEQLRESIKHDHAKAAETVDRVAELEARAQEAATLETRVKELNEALGKIAAIAAAGK